jgi:hypothetical protein
VNFWRIYEMGFPEGSNMKGPEGLRIPLGPFFFSVSTLFFFITIK